MRSILFHHPLPLSTEPTSGSQVRPVRMLEAFRELGCAVEAVVGYAKERRESIERVKAMVSAGRTFDFAYAESSTMPTLLTEPHHFPTHPLLDFGFFKYLSERSIPIGLFYRDVHWRFDTYEQQVSQPKRTVAKAFYWYDWLRYKRQIDHLFLPAVQMREALPGRWPEDKVSALPPGCIARNRTGGLESRTPGRALRLFYVGGVKPPLYDMKPTLRVIAELSDVRFTLCCRRTEWQQCQAHYGKLFDAQTMQVVHAHGAELSDHYHTADLFFDIWSDHYYRKLTLPVKITETLGFGVPIVTWAGTIAASFVKENGTGWVVSSKSEAKALIRHLVCHPEELEKKRRMLRAVQEKHTWKARAEQAAGVLRKASFCATAKQD